MSVHTVILCTCRGVDYLNARGSFTDPHTLTATMQDGTTVSYCLVIYMYAVIFTQLCIIETICRSKIHSWREAWKIPTLKILKLLSHCKQHSPYFSFTNHLQGTPLDQCTVCMYGTASRTPSLHISCDLLLSFSLLCLCAKQLGSSSTANKMRRHWTFLVSKSTDHMYPFHNQDLHNIAQSLCK